MEYTTITNAYLLAHIAERPEIKGVWKLKTIASGLSFGFYTRSGKHFISLAKGIDQAGVARDLKTYDQYPMACLINGAYL